MRNLRSQIGLWLACAFVGPLIIPHAQADSPALTMESCIRTENQSAVDPQAHTVARMTPPATPDPREVQLRCRTKIAVANISQAAGPCDDDVRCGYADALPPSSGNGSESPPPAPDLSTPSPLPSNTGPVIFMPYNPPNIKH